MRALVSVPSIRPTTPRSSTRRRRDTPATRRGFGGRRVLNNPTRAVVHSDATPRLPATAGGFFGDLDVAARTETRAAPAPHVVDRPPPGVVDHFPPPPVPHDEALSPFGPLEPEHGASHTRTSTHARHPHTIRIILTRPIDKHLAFMPAHAPAQHCALTELADPRDLPSPATGAVVTHVHPFPGLAGGLVLPGDQLLWLEDRAKTPGHLDATEAPFGTIDRVASEAGGSCVTLLFARWEDGEVQGGEFLAARY